MNYTMKYEIMKFLISVVETILGNWLRHMAKSFSRVCAPEEVKYIASF